MRKSLLVDAAVLHMVPSPEAVRVKFEQKMRQRGTVITRSDELLVARVDHGRWLADCPACNAGIALTPGVAEAYCFGHGCGHVFTTVTWPAAATVDEIERTLRARPKVATRNWLPTQTIEDLRQENRERSLPERHETAQERAARELQPKERG